MREIAADYHLSVPASSSEHRARQFNEPIARGVEVVNHIACDELLPHLLLLLSLEKNTSPFDGRGDLLQDVGEHFRDGLVVNFGKVVHEVGGLARKLFFVEGEYIAEMMKVSVWL